MSSASPLTWQDNQMCFACGHKNPIGLHLSFTPVGDDGLKTEFTPQVVHQGYADIVHGGFLGLLLDEVMVNLPYLRWKEVVVTAEMTVRLHRPARVKEPLIITAQPAGTTRSRLVPLRAEIRTPDGRLIASATAKCMKVGKSVS